MEARSLTRAKADRDVLDQLKDCRPVVTAGFLKRAMACVRVVELDGRLGCINGNGLEILQIADAETVKGRYWWEFWPVESRPILRNAITRGRLGDMVRFTADCPTTTGEMVTWDVRITPVQSCHGRIDRLLVVTCRTDGDAA